MLNFLKHNLWLGKLSHNLLLGKLSHNRTLCWEIVTQLVVGANCHTTQLVMGKLSHKLLLGKLSHNTTCVGKLSHNLLLGKLSHNMTCCGEIVTQHNLSLGKLSHKNIINCDGEIVTPQLLMLLNSNGQVFYFVCVKIGYVLLGFGKWVF